MLFTALQLWLPSTSVGEHHKLTEMRKRDLVKILFASMCSSESDLEGSDEVLDATVVYDMSGAVKLSGSSKKICIAVSSNTTAATSRATQASGEDA